MSVGRRDRAALTDANAGTPVLLTDQQYRDILAVRDRLRRFLSWSESQARAAGLTPAHHQLLLAVRGHPSPDPPAIGDVADHLQLRHHSAVGLVDRAEAAGLVVRVPDPLDRRVVRIRLQRSGAQALERLTALHLTELRLLADAFAALAPRESAGTDEQPRPAGQPAPRTGRERGC